MGERPSAGNYRHILADAAHTGKLSLDWRLLGLIEYCILVIVDAGQHSDIPQFAEVIMNADRFWSLVPYGMTLVASAGLLCVLVNPFCSFSPEGVSCGFSPEGVSCGFSINNAWKPYPGKAAGLQFFATVFLAAAAVFSWPVLRTQIARRTQIACYSGKWVVGWLEFCFSLGYPTLLLGIGIDLYTDNQEFTGDLIIGLVIIIASLGWLFIFYAIWLIIQGIRSLYNYLCPRVCCAFMSLCTRACRWLHSICPF